MQSIYTHKCTRIMHNVYIVRFSFPRAASRAISTQSFPHTTKAFQAFLNLRGESFTPETEATIVAEIFGIHGSEDICRSGCLVIRQSGVEL